ncbi:MAG: hypothetical protein ACLSWI_00035 [Candidatus Gastranaerophilaceae bacterium]
MKKVLLIFIIFIISSCNKGYCGVTIQSTGGTTIGSNYVSTPIQATITTLISLTLTMKVKALDQYITNTSNSNYKIPVSQLYLNNGTNEFQMIYNTQVTTINGLAITLLGYIVNYTCTIKNIGVLPPGTYTTRLQFDTNTTLSPDTAVYTLSFTIPYSQDVSTVTNPVNITLTPDNVFDGSAVVDNVTTPQIIVKSNGKWKLVMNTSSIGTLPANYYFLITGVSSNVTNYINTETQIQANQQYVLASGNPTVTAPVTGTYTTDYINLKYRLKNVSGTYIGEGSYNNNVTYSIQQGDN